MGLPEPLITNALKQSPGIDTVKQRKGKKHSEAVRVVQVILCMLWSRVPHLNQTSLTLGEAPLEDSLERELRPRRLRFPMRWTRLLPTASTAPFGASKVGPCAAASCTLNRRIAVPFQTPTVPGVAPAAEPTTISLEKMKPQRRDSYHPIESADHSNDCARTGVGSAMMLATWGSSANDGRLWIRVRASGLVVACRAASGMCGAIAEMRVRIVCKGSSGNQDSS